MQRILLYTVYFAVLRLLITSCVQGKKSDKNTMECLQLSCELKSVWDMFVSVYMKLKPSMTPGSYLGPSSKFLRYFAL